MSRLFTIDDSPQRSAAWHALRAGKLTSSCAATIHKAGKTKGEESYLRRDLRLRLALEQMTGHPQEDDERITRAMERGIEQEEAARIAYQIETALIVEQAGFLVSTSHKAGTSLDGYVGDFEGIVELKNPKTATHVGYIQEQEAARRMGREWQIPSDYFHQIRHHVWITGAQWADFVSFDDRMPAHLQLVICRMTREQLDIPGYEAAALTFLKEVEDAVAMLRSLRTVAA